MVDKVRDESSRPAREQSLREAQQAAVYGDPIRMLAALNKDGALDGIVRRLAFQYSDVPYHVIEDKVAKAVDELYEHVRAGKPLSSTVAGFLSWRADKRVLDHLNGREFKLIKSLSPDELQVVVDNAVGSQHRDIYFPETEGEEEADAAASGELLKKARELVPKLGEERIQMVATLLLDALDHLSVGELEELASGGTILSNQTIADTLGINVSHAKVLKSRAIKRIIERAAEVGLPGIEALTIYEDDKSDK